MTVLKMLHAGLALALTVVFAATVHAETQAPHMVPMEPHNGAFVIPVVLNNVLTKKFIVDSGAADVSIPAEVFSALKSSGTLTGADLLGSKKYMMADGSIIPSEIYRVASLNIGGLLVENVTVRISAANSDLLLGQSFLKRLKSWSMDNARQVMIFN